MDSDNWGWCWLNMKGSPALDLYYLVGIQGYAVLIHFRLSAVYLFHHKVMLRIFIRILQTGTVLDNALPILVFIQLLSVSLTFDSFSQLHVHLSHFCCSQYPSSQRVMSVEVKFLPQIKWSEMKMLSRRVLRLVTLMEAGPLSGLAEAPHFPLNRNTVRLHPVMWQQSQLAELKPSNHVSCSRYPLIFSPFWDCLNKLTLSAFACASKWLYHYLEAWIPPVSLFAGFASVLK